MTGKNSRNICLAALCLATFAIVGLFAGCTKADPAYSNHQCYLIYDNSLHLSSRIVGAVTPPGSDFILLSRDAGSIPILRVNSYGQPEDEVIELTTERERQTTMILGYNNGIFVGYSILGDAGLLAFDRNCPKCVNNYSARLNWHNNGRTVKCPVCNTVYDLTQAGNGLDRYHASFDGSILRVMNY